jgi:hypothetical protein
MVEALQRQVQLQPSETEICGSYSASAAATTSCLIDRESHCFKGFRVGDEVGVRGGVAEPGHGPAR